MATSSGGDSRGPRRFEHEVGGPRRANSDSDRRPREPIEPRGARGAPRTKARARRGRGRCLAQGRGQAGYEPAAGEAPAANHRRRRLVSGRPASALADAKAARRIDRDSPTPAPGAASRRPEASNGPRFTSSARAETAVNPRGRRPDSLAGRSRCARKASERSSPCSRVSRWTADGRRCGAGAAHPALDHRGHDQRDEGQPRRAAPRRAGRLNGGLRRATASTWSARLAPSAGAATSAGRCWRAGASGVRAGVLGEHAERALRARSTGSSTA